VATPDAGGRARNRRWADPQHRRQNPRATGESRLDPFPRQARYPLSQALKDGDLKSARAFLPEGFADQPLLTPAELVELARAISPKVKQLTEDMRPMVQ